MKGLFAKYGLRETVPVLATNTAFARSLIGTPVTPALAARSLIFANPVSNGDILIAANEGGNSQAYVWIDGSAGEMRLYGSGTLAATITASSIASALDLTIANGVGVVVGNTAQIAVLAATPELQVLGTAAADSGLVLLRSSADTTGPILYFAKARDAIGTFTTAITSGDVLGGIEAIGADTADLNANANAAAAIRFVSSGTIAADRIPGEIRFLTATDAAPSVLTLRMSISNAGVVDMPFTLTVGASGTRTGTIGIDGATSGTVTVDVAAAAGTWSYTLPTTAGEAGDVQVSDGSGNASWVSGVRSVDVQLTNAQVLALRATPIALVAAPGANRAIIVHKVYFYLDAGAGAYTETVDNLVVEYAGGTDITGSIEATGWVAGGARTYGVLDTELTPVANEAVQLFNTGDGEWGGGNAANTLSVRVWYSVVDTVAFT